jgi:type IV pilus assembly protein PilA
MIVVVVSGILASLAVVGYRKYVDNAKTSEAREIILAIRGGQDAFFDETFRYLDVSGTIDNYYPMANPVGSSKTMWGAPSAVQANFQRLGVSPDSAVYFGYASVANDGTSIPSPGAGVTAALWGNPAPPMQPFYMVKAVCDVDGVPSAKTVFVTTSLQADIYTENLGK